MDKSKTAASRVTRGTGAGVRQAHARLDREARKEADPAGPPRGGSRHAAAPATGTTGYLSIIAVPSGGSCATVA